MYANVTGFVELTSFFTTLQTYIYENADFSEDIVTISFTYYAVQDLLHMPAFPFLLQSDKIWSVRLLQGPLQRNIHNYFRFNPLQD
ncbi:hypothetical protein YC2023_074677 [Brassica napus]